MTNKYRLEVEFVAAEDMGRENVEHILGQFLRDVAQTDRFIDARIVTTSTLDEGEAQELLDMLDRADYLDETKATIDELHDETDK